MTTSHISIIIFLYKSYLYINLFWGQQTFISGQKWDERVNFIRNRSLNVFIYIILTAIIDLAAPTLSKIVDFSQFLSEIEISLTQKGIESSNITEVLRKSTYFSRLCPEMNVYWKQNRFIQLAVNRNVFIRVWTDILIDCNPL